MIIAPHYQGEKVAVFGLARSGLAAAKSLMAGHARVCAWDDSEDRRVVADQQGIPLVDLYQIDFGEVMALVLSPGIPHTYPAPHAIAARAKASSCPIINDIELFARVQGGDQNARIVVITGTNGKSTTTALLGHVLAACDVPVQIGGNIGRPALELGELPGNGVYVLELSSYQIELAGTLRPDIAALINITPDHLERHGGMAGYIAAKQMLFDRQLAGQTAIIGTDDGPSRDILERLTQGAVLNVVPVTLNDTAEFGVFVTDGQLFDALGNTPEAVGDLRECACLPGRHNWQNAAIAYAVCRSLGLPPAEIFTAFCSFEGLAHRLESVAEIDGVRFINDSKATNAEAAKQAISVYPSIFWIAGGIAKEGGIAALAPLFGHIERAYLIGQAAAAFAEELEPDVPVVACASLEEAVSRAAADAWQALSEGDRSDPPVVLLSPACASFDQFEDFEARGAAFRDSVNQLCRKVQV